MIYTTRACRSKQAFIAFHGVNRHRAIADLCHSSLIPQVSHAHISIGSPGA
jgi:hypothetical protein